MTTGTRREILRYLGTETPDARLSGIIADIAAELETNAPPKSVYRIFDCKTSSALTEIDGLAINSAGLARHMAGCRRAVLFAATLGAGADVLIRRYTVSGMEKAAVAQAVCAALLEEYCDKIMADMAGEPLLAGWYPRARFSPGYGDFDIAYQKDILRLLRGDVRIGLTLTGGNMLAPSKSVTAVVGFSEEASGYVGCASGKCGTCENKTCTYRQPL